MINNDCSWQLLTLSGSMDGENFQNIGKFPQCAPFGHYIKSFTLKEYFKFIKIELSGFGQLIFNYARIVGPEAMLKPLSITMVSGNVINPEYFLVDDLRPVTMGSVETKKYFIQGKEQPKSSIVLKMIH